MRLSIFFVLVCFPICLLAQNNKKFIHNIYLEGLGNSDWYSLNYEYVKNNKSALRLGFSMVPGTNQFLSKNDRYFWYLPIEKSYLMGNKKHKFNLSFGIQTLFTYYIDFPNHFRFRPQLGIGYRYQKKKGIFFRLGVVTHIPIFLSIDRYDVFFYSGKNWLHWPQLAIGYSF